MYIWYYTVVGYALFRAKSTQEFLDLGLFYWNWHMENSTTEHLKTAFLKNLLSGNRSACSEITREYLDINPSIEDLYEDLFRVSLYMVGTLWETNKISVATEHMATAITEGLLNELYEQIISQKRYPKSVVLACVENEKHQVGIKMVGDIFEKNGWESFFLGAGLPTGELIRFINQSNPTLLAVSLSVYFNLPNLLKMLTALRSAFPDLPIIVGGQAIQSIKAVNLPVGCQAFDNLYQLETYIKNLNK